MPLYPPRSQEPYKKKETLSKREQQLRHAMSTGAATDKLQRAAQNVREAQLAVLKAEHELIRYAPESEEKSRQVASIARKRETWRDMTPEAIILRYWRDPN